MPSPRRRSFLALAASAVLMGSGLARAQETAPAKPAARHFDVHRASGPIKIDGVLDDAGWSDAVTWDVPFEWQPGDNVKPPVATDFLVTYDEDRLYLAWRCHDPEPGRIRAHYMDRDSIDTFVQDDHVVLLIDTFNDERRGFQFRINPLGVQADAINSENEGVEDWSFDLIWDSAAKIGPDGWVAEVAIPFSQLRFPRSTGPQTWGFDVGRSWPRDVRHRMAAHPIDRGANCGLCQVDKVSGFEGMKAGKGLEFDPTLTARRTEVRQDFPDGEFRTEESKVDPGLSARWGITTNLSLNAAINPDFSQVEADAAQLAVNERFALFFPEKRPFFLEGVDFFSTPIDAVFTRTVVNPDWGIKLTGKEGANAIGAYVARDTHNALTFPGNQFSDSAFLEDEKVTSGVFRYRRDIWNRSAVGVLYAGRDGDGYSNDLWGVDGNLRFDDSNSLKVQYLRSSTLYPGTVAAAYGQPQGDFSGDALALEYDYVSRNWNAGATWDDRDPGFRADSGYVPQVDIRRAKGWANRTFWGEGGGWYDRLSFTLDGQRTEDHSDRKTDDRIRLDGLFVGSLQSAIELTVSRSSLLLGGVLHDALDLYEAYGEMQPSGVVKFTLYTRFGDEVDSFNNQVGEVLLVNPSVELKLGRHVNAQVNHTLRRLDVPGGELFRANLTQLRLVYNFNVRSFARAIVQYTDLRRDPALFPFAVDPKTETLFTQLLFSYKLNAQTVLFVGFSDNYLGFESVDLTVTDRTVFAKVGYALLR
jgi:hypothetical protein